jgi:hypothetical protein
MQSIEFLSLTLKKVMIFESNSAILIVVGYLYSIIKRNRDFAKKKTKKIRENVKI